MILMFERLPYVPEIANVIYLCMAVTFAWVLILILYRWIKNRKVVVR